MNYLIYYIILSSPSTLLKISSLNYFEAFWRSKIMTSFIIQTFKKRALKNKRIENITVMY